MIIKLKVEHRTKYYQHTSAGKPILGSKSNAASFDEPTAKKVLEHLRTIDARFVEAELVSA